ncbi:alpha/beta fold hydrolase [Leptospira stimsonii]|uniref:Alpha/beta hydrolase n=1 Tax=Leptospira stimsonii TaxID=2202203 RepID=A0ABY2NEH9_9LEPT|nr:alpha/beta hydrolase [Leptospira stimsonii]TGK26000.1 alpha/beta hydrolase [Leptospira stimsonii]TGM22433.1 alpha/beta hydrolase [Leptospira stimsonii]
MKHFPILICIALFLFALSCSTKDPLSLREGSFMKSEPTKTGLVPIGDIQLYYEIHGNNDGIPLVLLNGGGSTIEVTFSKVLPIFAKHRMVIGLDEQGHGRTSDRKGPVRFETSAEDVVSLLQYLKIDKVDLFGFSNGASVALQVSLKHPDLVRKLVFASSITKKSGASPQFWTFMKKATFETMPQALKDAFLKVNPDPKKLYTMFEKDRERMINFRDVSDKEIGSIKATTLIVTGDRDIGRPEHAIELARKIPNARLLILPGGHGDYLGEAIQYQDGSSFPTITAALVEEFLGPPDSEKNP